MMMILSTKQEGMVVISSMLVECSYAGCQSM